MQTKNFSFSFQGIIQFKRNLIHAVSVKQVDYNRLIWYKKFIKFGNIC